MPGEAKISEFDKFSPICAKYNTTPQDSRIIICKGRKVGYVLSIGEINFSSCFLNERATKSTKEALVYESTLIPNGWKVALEVKRTIYVGETSIRGPSLAPLFRFSRVNNEGEVEDSSEFREHPTPAFTEVATRNPVMTSGQESERPNGKLYMGIQYTEAQQWLRNRASIIPVASAVMDDFQRWKSLKHIVEPFPLQLPVQPTMTTTSMPVTLSSAAAAASSSTAAASFLFRANTAATTQHNASKKRSNDIASLQQVGLIAMRAMDEKPDIRSEMSSFRPSKLQKEGSTREAMRMLRENSLELDPEDLDFDSLELQHAGSMTPEAMFHIFKNPGVDYLNMFQMKRAIETLLQMAVPKKLVAEMFEACDVLRTGKVTLLDFVRVIQKRDEELRAQFQSIDFDGDEQITMDELRGAQARGLFSAQERELNAVLEAMDLVSKRDGDLAHVDQKIQWHEFRSMMVLLPPASTIQAIVNIVKSQLEERDLIESVQNEPLKHSFPHIPPPTKRMFDLYETNPQPRMLFPQQHPTVTSQQPPLFDFRYQAPPPPYPPPSQPFDFRFPAMPSQVPFDFRFQHALNPPTPPASDLNAPLPPHLFLKQTRLELDPYLFLPATDPNQYFAVDANPSTAVPTTPFEGSTRSLGSMGRHHIFERSTSLQQYLARNPSPAVNEAFGIDEEFEKIFDDTRQ